MEKATKELDYVHRQIMTVSRSLTDFLFLVTEIGFFLEKASILNESKFEISSLVLKQRHNELISRYSSINMQILKLKERHKSEIQDSRIEATRRYRELEMEFRTALKTESERYNENHEKLKIDILEERKRHELSTVVYKGEINRLEADLDEKSLKIDEQNNDRYKCAALQKEIETYLMQISHLKEEQTILIDKIKPTDYENLKTLSSDLAKQVDSLKSNLNVEEEKVRIKSKIIDDQLDTIQRLKTKVTLVEGLYIKEKGESLKFQKKMEQHLTEYKNENIILKAQMQKISSRKDELKDKIINLQDDIEVIERKKKCLESESADQEEEIVQLRSQINAYESDWRRTVTVLESERNDARREAKMLSEKLKMSNLTFEKRISDAERSAKLQVAQLEQEMRELLSESALSRRKVENTLRTLAGSI